MKISVLMPVFNGDKYLQEAIDSILNQSFKDFEFIIIDDGSTDRSLEIIVSNSKKDSRIKILRNEINSGICVTLNKGLEAAQGEYIARMDCDDIAVPDRFLIQSQFLDNHIDYGLVGSNTHVFGEGLNKSYDFIFDRDWRMCKSDMIFATCVAHPSVMIRSEIIRKYNLRYDEDFVGMEDFYLWWEIAKYTKITNIQKPLLNYRLHTKQVTKKVPNEEYNNKEKRFLLQRLNDLHIQLNNTQLNLMLRYIRGDFKFTDSELEAFIELCRKILNDINTSKPEIFKIAKIVMTKAILQSVNASSAAKSIFKNKRYYFLKSYSIGCMPSTWFLKSLLHCII